MLMATSLLWLKARADILNNAICSMSKKSPFYEYASFIWRVKYILTAFIVFFIKPENHDNSRILVEIRLYL